MREACRTPAYAKALSLLIDRVPPEDVTDDLTKLGLDEPGAARVVKYSKDLLERAKNGPGNALIGIGVTLLGGGIIVTVVTMMTAFESGGFYVVWYGAVFFGIGLIMHGIRKNRFPDMDAVRRELDAAMDAARDGDDPAADGTDASGGSGRKYDY